MHTFFISSHNAATQDTSNSPGSGRIWNTSYRVAVIWAALIVVALVPVQFTILAALITVLWRIFPAATTLVGRPGLAYAAVVATIPGGASALRDYEHARR